MNLEDIVEIGKRHNAIQEVIKKFSQRPYANVALELIDAAGEDYILEDFPNIDPNLLRNLDLGMYEQIVGLADAKSKKDLIDSVQSKNISEIVDYFGNDDEARGEIVNLIAQMNPAQYQGINSTISEAHEAAYEATKGLQNMEEGFNELLEKHEGSIAAMVIAFLAAKNPEIVKSVMVGRTQRAVKGLYDSADLSGIKGHMALQYNNSEDGVKNGVAYAIGQRLAA